MCLSKVDFSFEEGKDYGVGYRVYSHKPCYWNDKYEELRISTKNEDTYERLTKNKWYKAAKEFIYNKTHYTAGFHIFLKKEDALDYLSYIYNKKEIILCKVHYKDIVAFGQNETTGSSSGPCIIARQMKIVEATYAGTGKPFINPRNRKKRESKCID